MRDKNIGAVVIAQADEPLGIVTDRDLVIRVLAEDRPPQEIELGSIMSTHPAFLARHRTLDDAIAAMRQYRIRRLPVVDESGNLDGILSLDDLLMLLGRQFGEIGEAVREELAAPTSE